MIHTKKSLNSISKRVAPQEICLLNETHNFLNGSELLTFLDDKVFVDISHCCFPCELRTREKYAIGVNTRQIKYPYELYRDTTIETSLDNLILYNDFTDIQQRQKLVELQQDLQAFKKEKVYDVELETEEQKLAYLNKQNFFKREYPNDKKIKYTIHYPLDREFTLPSETAAINSLSKKVEVHARRMYFAVYKDE